MSDLEINVPTFEAFLAEGAKELSDASHAKHNGDATADKVDGTLPGGTPDAEPVKKSADAADKEGSPDDLPKPPVS